ncbi:esterase-like activity of phytase family protein [Sulfitobacter albidus]|uniref:Esterase-like activity of phytase family protein n=1 Tax=Sulfitobacter albidus TaxID=2829501 RepID=A0A975JDN5_9RHOB|nr:esterase-like activity of phytase family protein [Sulfitobacter albidus]QUJ76345.1 esterase-like activity of phytase family protein [Sulfitobacter albidus]
MKTLLALICVLAATTASAEPRLRFDGALPWRGSNDWFGGWSGIEVQESGTRAIIIGDRGHLLSVDMQRQSGALRGLTITRSTDIGAGLPKKSTDAEGLAIGADGTAYVSFEHRHRVSQMDIVQGTLGQQWPLPFPVEDNAGVEALAIDPDGTLYAVAEAPPKGAAHFPLYALDGFAWRLTAKIPQRGPFRPVGADFDDQGRYWLLERAATPLGFRSRIRMFTLAPARESVLLTTPPSRFDNLEGISLWRDPAGHLRLTMISDDNFLRIQRTQLVEYTVEE